MEPVQSAIQGEESLVRRRRRQAVLVLERAFHFLE
jgi:hypothetical protein